MTNKQAKDIETVIYFIPDVMRHITITDEDKIHFLEWSEQGKHKDKVQEYTMNGFNALVQGKQWRGIHMQMYEDGVLEGTMPYFTILGGYDKPEQQITISSKPRKWWQFWKPKYSLVKNIKRTSSHSPMPRSVVDFMKKEMFKGVDAEIIEKCYQSIIV